MNAGFSNLDTLKKTLLAGTMKADVRFDKIIAALGLGMATMFENTCNRKFARLVGVQETFPADRCEFCLSRKPVESVATAELKLNETDGWVMQDATYIRAIDLKNAIINTGDRDAGPYYAQVRFTFTGGYFWETLEPDDANFPSDLPDGASALPDDLFNAWILQCRHIWNQLDKTGANILKDGEEKSLRFPQDFAPTVENTLGQYKNFNLA